MRVHDIKLPLSEPFAQDVKRRPREGVVGEHVHHQRLEAFGGRIVLFEPRIVACKERDEVTLVAEFAHQGRYAYADAIQYRERAVGENRHAQGSSGRVRVPDVVRDFQRIE